MLRKVTVENGIVEGLPAADPRITSFKGIPFAAPAVGENRWRAPQPAKNWMGVLQAYKFGPVAMQSIPGLDTSNLYSREWNVDPDIEMGEDCLQLNVWTPARKTDAKLPVFLWFYGGGLQVGNPAEMEFDGERIARRGIVVVTTNYRVNLFGFLCHPEITAEAPEKPANFGNLDQQAALRWIKRNIAAFGGDPDNVTIGGQSAGGGSVLSQLTSPQNKGMIQKAIVESGISMRPYPGTFSPGGRMTLKQAEAEGVKFFAHLGVKTLAEARALPAEYIRDKSIGYVGHWATVEDGLFCVGGGFDLFIRNKREMVPVLLGRTSSEFFSAPAAATADEFRAAARQTFGEDADKFLSLCASETDSIAEMQNKANVSMFECAIRTAGKLNTETGANLPLYYYVFGPSVPGWDNPGTFHSCDLWFFFETLAKCWRPFEGKHYDLARLMCNYWANFIKSGDPNGKDANGKAMPKWEKLTKDAPYAMYFNEECTGMCYDEPTPVTQFLVDRYVENLKF